MKLELEYRDNDFFNSEDFFVFLDKACTKVFSSRVHFYNGNWYTNNSLKFKCTSIKSDRYKETLNNKA